MRINIVKIGGWTILFSTLIAVIFNITVFIGSFLSVAVPEYWYLPYLVRVCVICTIISIIGFILIMTYYAKICEKYETKYPWILK